MSKRKAIQESGDGLSDDVKRPKTSPTDVLGKTDVVLAPQSYAHLLGPNLTHISLIVVVLLLMVNVFVMEDPHARMWVMIGLLSYLASRSWHSILLLVSLFFGQRYLQIHISAQRCLVLFNAVTQALIESKGGKRNGIDGVVSRDCDGTMQVDYVTGQKKVKLGFWGRSSRQETIYFVDGGGKTHRVSVDYERGNESTDGDSIASVQQSLTLSMPCTEGDLPEKHAALRFFCQSAYDTYTQPEKGTVDVFFPYARSSDWAPEWKHERSIKIATSSEQSPKTVNGLRYYMMRSDFTEVLNDAKLWSRDKLRVYIIYGPPGVGKTHFVTKLAQTLGLPVYRAPLTSLSLGDDSLQQLFSASVMLHEAALVHFDEFQGVLESWRSVPGSTNKCKVTLEGFNEFLQGGSSMQKGVVVLTGSLELGKASEEFAALFRRAACTCMVGPLREEEIAHYFCVFLKAFLCTPEEVWHKWMQRFIHLDIGSRAWSIDSLQQYLMKRITQAADRGIVESTSSAQSDEARWKVKDGHADSFLEMIVDSEPCLHHLDEYAVKY